MIKYIFMSVQESGVSNKEAYERDLRNGKFLGLPIGTYLLYINGELKITGPCLEAVLQVSRDNKSSSSYMLHQIGK